MTGCNPLETILYSPRQTPESWLRLQPFIEFQMAAKSVIIVQPTTTVIVYLLGLVAIGAGAYFWRIRQNHRARRWWGVALVLWGLGAWFAGTSYEAFSYHLKCAGREACLWTSGWEISYLVVSIASVDALLMAQAYAGATALWRRRLIAYAIINFTGYVITVAIGTVVPIQFLISFELLLIVTAPTVVIFIIQNGWRYFKFKQGLDLALLGAWGWLALTIGAYFLYLISGLTQRLWAQGVWFSENDVLHIGLIIWMAYLAGVVARRVVDAPQ